MTWKEWSIRFLRVFKHSRTNYIYPDTSSNLSSGCLCKTFYGPVYGRRWGTCCYKCLWQNSEVRVKEPPSLMYSFPIWTRFTCPRKFWANACFPMIACKLIQWCKGHVTSCWYQSIKFSGLLEKCSDGFFVRDINLILSSSPSDLNNFISRFKKIQQLFSQ